MIQFEARWGELNPRQGEPSFLRVDETHPLDFYLGKDVTGERCLLLITDNEPPTFPQSQAISVKSAKRQDGRWALLFRLTRSELGLVFSHLCEDLVDSSRGIDNVATGGTIILARFVRWQRLLERGSSGLLDEAALRGLLGEILFLELVAIPYHGAERALEGWFGPTGADQDFRFPETWYEVKSIRPGASVVTISSVEQLDAEGYDGELAVVCIDKAVKDEPGCFTPASLIGRVRAMLEVFPVAGTRFEDLLLEANYVDNPDYEKEYYVMRNLRRYIVGEGFPKITRASISAGIRNVEYEVELSRIAPFERANP